MYHLPNNVRGDLIANGPGRMLSYCLVYANSRFSVHMRGCDGCKNNRRLPKYALNLVVPVCYIPHMPVLYQHNQLHSH